MGKVKMPKNKHNLEDMLVNAFLMGMTSGYGVAHEELSDDERIYANRYRALIQGKIEDMSEIVNGEKTYTERMAEKGVKSER